VKKDFLLKIMMLLSFIVSIAIIFKVGYNEAENKYTEELKRANITIDNLQGAENEAYRQCQMFMAVNKRINKVDGCVAGISQLCAEKRPGKAAQCFELLKSVCNRLEEEYD